MAQRLKFLRHSNNLIVAGSVSGDADANFPATHLQELPISKLWKRTFGSPVSSVTLTIDLGSSKTPDIFGLVNHRLTSDATITLRNTSVSPATETTIPWAKRLAWKIFSLGAGQNWEVEISDDDNPDGFFSGGYLALGVAETWPSGFSHEWNIERIISQRRVESEIGAPHVGATVYRGSRLSLSFPGLETSSDWEALDDLLDELDLGADPLLLVPDPDEREAFFARLETPHSISRFARRAEVPTIDFLTDGLGAIVAS